MPKSNTAQNRHKIISLISLAHQFTTNSVTLPFMKFTPRHGGMSHRRSLANRVRLEWSSMIPILMLQERKHCASDLASFSSLKHTQKSITGWRDKHSGTLTLCQIPSRTPCTGQGQFSWSYPEPGGIKHKQKDVSVIQIQVTVRVHDHWLLKF